MLNRRQNRKPAHNSGLAKVAVSFSADTFVVNQSLVLRIIFCGENRHLSQAAKRYMRFFADSLPKTFQDIYGFPSKIFI